MSYITQVYSYMHANGDLVLPVGNMALRDVSDNGQRIAVLIYLAGVVHNVIKVLTKKPCLSCGKHGSLHGDVSDSELHRATDNRLRRRDWKRDCAIT